MSVPSDVTVPIAVQAPLLAQAPTWFRVLLVEDEAEQRKLLRLPKAEIGIVAVSGWGQEGHTDEQGKVSFPLPWKGPYLVSIRHVDSTPGKRPAAAGKPEEKYDLASFTTTLSFVTPAGLPSPPAPRPPARSEKE